MTSQTLREARKYEEASEKFITKEERPEFHLSTRVGWTNDPNGFSFYQGKYHMFYQYYPYSTEWGPMHWGHAVSEDLLHWEYLPAALAPDEGYDRDGCFSGSAVTLSDGRHLLMYTGVLKERKSTGEYVDIQTQCLAVGDGCDYVKYEKNPVLDRNDLPEGSSIYDFRDPKMWQKKDGTYACVVGNRPADGSGQILLFESPDGFDWKFASVLSANENRFGKMWECPDFFELDGKWVLLTSPQDMLPQDLEYHNGNGTLCLMGSFDEQTNAFTEEVDQCIDYGVDFYATQTTLAPDGRRIMIGWMQNWDTCSHRAKGEKWFGQMSLPRELFIKDNRLYQRPVRELEQMRCNKVVHENVSFTGDLSLEGVSGRKIDMELTLKPGEGEDSCGKFTIFFAQNEEYRTSLSYRVEESILKVDRKFSGSRRAITHQRRAQVHMVDGALKLRIILDRFSAEVFINDGEQVMTTTIYTDQKADGISFSAEGNATIDVTKYDLI